MDFDALTNVVASNVVGYDEVELGNQMVTSPNDAWQTCGVSMDQSNRPNGDLNMHVNFNMAKRTFRIWLLCGRQKCWRG